MQQGSSSRQAKVPQEEEQSAYSGVAGDGGFVADNKSDDALTINTETVPTTVAGSELVDELGDYLESHSNNSKEEVRSQTHAKDCLIFIAMRSPRPSTEKYEPVHMQYKFPPPYAGSREVHKASARRYLAACIRRKFVIMRRRGVELHMPARTCRYTNYTSGSEPSVQEAHFAGLRPV